MTTTLRSLQKTFVETNAGVDKQRYLEQFAARALSDTASPHYSADVEFGPGEFHPEFTLVERLSKDSELFSKIPLAPASDKPETKFADLPPNVQRLCESYPLVDGEHIASIKMLCLDKDWEGLAERTVFVERETDLARVYFAVPGLRADPRTPGLSPAVLLRLGSVPIANSAAVTAIPMASAAAGGASFDDIGRPIISCVLDIVSSLAWATPGAGPFVAAGVVFINFIMGAVCPPKSTLLDDIKTIADGVVQRLEYFHEEVSLKENLQSLQIFAAWIGNVETELNTQNPETFKVAVTQQGGILEQLNGQLGPNVQSNLFGLKTRLLADNDFQLGEPYASRHQWSMASAKLHLLFLTTAQYLFALKLKIILIATLYKTGFDVFGASHDPPIANPDSTFKLLVKEITEFKDQLPGLIERVRSRRQGMVVVEENSCTVAYSQLPRETGKPDAWNDMMGRRDALYIGWYKDQLVRSQEDNPSMDQFETAGGDDVCDFKGACRRIPLHMAWFSWHRMEIRDRAVYDGNTPQDWILRDYHCDWSYYSHDDHRVAAAKEQYIATVVLPDFDKWAKVPEVLSDDISTLRDRWQPQIPAKLPDGGGLVFGDWGDTAKEGELWSDKTVSVRYRFTLRSQAYNESAKSNDISSTLWVAPNGRCRPTILGLPTTGDYLTYVEDVCLYRRFRKELPNGSYKCADERLVKVISRAEGQAGFAGHCVDERSAAPDKQQFDEG